MVEPAIEIRGLLKRFKKFRRVENYTTLKSMVMGFLRGGGKTEVERWNVIDGIDLVVPRGMSLGIIGANGSGKSTLLRLLAGIYLPDEAETWNINGRVAAMLELGAGFHPEFTGEENAEILGILMGFSRAEVKQRKAAMIEFSELGDTIYAPVRTYSSGQVVRLAFSVVTHLDPDIFLIDEALAVGDGAFVAKCHDRLRALRSGDKTLIVVTHDEQELYRSCDQVCVMNDSGLTPPMEPRDAVKMLEGILGAPMSAQSVFLAGMPGLMGPRHDAKDDNGDDA